MQQPSLCIPYDSGGEALKEHAGTGQDLFNLFRIKHLLGILSQSRHGIPEDGLCPCASHTPPWHPLDRLQYGTNLRRDQHLNYPFRHRKVIPWQNSGVPIEGSQPDIRHAIKPGNDLDDRAIGHDGRAAKRQQHVLRRHNDGTCQEIVQIGMGCQGQRTDMAPRPPVGQIIALRVWPAAECPYGLDQLPLLNGQTLHNIIQLQDRSLQTSASNDAIRITPACNDDREACVDQRPFTAQDDLGRCLLGKL